MTLTDAEARHLTISLLTAPTERDAQVKVGASNLSNGCQFCLASNLTGDMRETPITDRAWGGRVLGTAIHSILEERASAPWFKERYPDALTEYRMRLGTLGTYGEIGSTADLVLPSERHAFDYKGTTDAKSAITLDFLAIKRGEKVPYGRTHKVHKAKTLSESVYATKLKEAEYKIAGYYAQLQVYGLGLNREGIAIDRLSIVNVSRDNSMWFDNPASDGYETPERTHGTWVLSFDYNEQYAEAIWNKGLQIWNGLDSGKTPADYPKHDLCFPCSLEARESFAA